MRGMLGRLNRVCESVGQAVAPTDDREAHAGLDEPVRLVFEIIPQQNYQ